MLRRSLLALALGLPLVGTAHAADDDPAASSMPGPLDGIGRHLAGSFVGPNLMFHFAAVAATATLTSQDADAEVRKYFHEHTGWGHAAYPMVIAGVAGPVALFGGLHLAGRSTRNPETVGAAWAVLQAGALTLGYVTVLKLVTGRPAPRDDFIPALATDETTLSRTFRPGFYRGGVIAGWPSGHVAVTTAMLSALAAYYPDSVLLKLALAVGSAAMMVSVSSFEAGGMHWASDAVAGALFALPIGLSTGQGMRRLVSGKAPASPTAWFVTPSLRPDLTGASVGHVF
jgi:membrane-associated phospholipid phosphatase